MYRHPMVSALGLATMLVFVSAFAIGPLLRGSTAHAATEATASPLAAGGDFAGLVDIGGRSLYLECHGTGSPTVILVAG
jgi:hypothetical protein